MATIAGTAPTGYAGLRTWETVLDWLTTVDHKKIGILYIVTAGLFGLGGGALSLVVRTELAETGALIEADTYNQMFTMHASIMLFLFIIPVSVGFMNYAVPLQIGALDMAFPRVNALSYWIFLFGGVLMISAFAFDGGAASAGWTAYPPITSNSPGNLQPPGVGMDLWLIGIVPPGQRLHPWRHQLPRHHLQDARPRHDHVPHAHVRLDHAHHGLAHRPRHPRPGRHPDPPLRRPQRRRRRLLRPHRRVDRPSSGRTSSGSTPTPPSTS